MKKIISIVLASMSLFSLCACGSGTGNGPTGGNNDSVGEQIVDKTKTQIVFSVFNGGYGYKWAFDAAEAWNATNEDYQVIVSPNKDEWHTISANLEAGSCQYDLFLDAPSKDVYAKGLLEDLSSLLTSKTKGDEKTLESKLMDAEMNEVYFTYNGEYFALPFSEGFSGFVYDHDIFKEKKLLIGTDGKLITSATQELSAGRDGVKGTVDDGHPVTMAEYNLMINAIKQSGLYTYLWTGKFSYYTEPLYWSLFYDYAGKENVEQIYKKLDGTYTNPKTNESIVITKENGYEASKMAGIYESLSFIDTYLADPTLYHPSAAKYGTSHTDAQKVFVYGNAFEGATADKQVAFLYEGTWWEYEAKANFNSLVSRGYNEYEYGTRDYRMMLTPVLDEYGEYDEVPLAGFDHMGIGVKKQSDAGKLAAIKDFLLYLYSDESIKQIIKTANVMMPFNVDMTESDLASMTKFSRNMYELYTNEKTYFVSMKYGVTSPVNRSVLHYQNSQTAYPIDFFLRGPGISTKCNAQQGYDATYEYFKTNWTSLLK